MRVRRDLSIELGGFVDKRLHLLVRVLLDANRIVLSEGDAVGVQQYTYEEMKALVDEATKLDRKVAAHAHGVEGIKTAVRAGVSSIEHGSFLDEEAAKMMVQRGTYLVPTLSAGEAAERAVT